MDFTFHFLEQFALPIVAAVGALLVRQLSRIRIERVDLAVGLDLIVGALFTLVLFGIEAASHIDRFWLDWPSAYTYPVTATALLLILTGIIVRTWGWNRVGGSVPVEPQLRAMQGIVIPMVASVIALLLVVRQVSG
jgi:protein-S-isoprenylcysteine O-methyltransferase Ste14